MKYLIALLALGLAACATPSAPSLTGRMDWRCDNDRAFSARIGADGRAEVFAGGQVYRLPHVAGASGARYQEGGVEYWERGGQATLGGAAGGPYQNCRRS